MAKKPNSSDVSYLAIAIDNFRLSGVPIPPECMEIAQQLLDWICELLGMLNTPSEDQIFERREQWIESIRLANWLHGCSKLLTEQIGSHKITSGKVLDTYPLISLDLTPVAAMVTKFLNGPEALSDQELAEMIQLCTLLGGFLMCEESVVLRHAA